MNTNTYAISTEKDREVILSRAYAIASEFGFDELDCTLIKMAVSELCSNILRYAEGGSCEIASTENHRGLRFTFTDRGPGIKDIDFFLIDGNSSNPQSLGVGFGAVKRASDDFTIESIPGRGTVVELKKYLPVPPSLLQHYIVTFPDARYFINGDDYLVKYFDGDSALFAVLDGMGQGKHANEICNLCKPIISEYYYEPLDSIIERCHHHLKKKESELGLAMGLLKVSPRHLSFAAVGDTFAKAFPPKSYSFQSQDGIVGLFHLPTIKIKIHERLPEETVIIMCTDGIQNSLNQEEVLLNCHPREIAEKIYQRHRRPMGDATVLVVKLGATK